MRWLVLALLLALLAPHAAASPLDTNPHAVPDPERPSSTLVTACHQPVCAECESHLTDPACMPDCETTNSTCYVLWGRDAAAALVCSEGSGTGLRVGLNLGGPTGGCTMIGPP